ncbi:hypothetical protein LXL04_016290 [Taraxacum kok-saghyz]
MDVINEETTPYQNQIVLDFVDHLPPGYRFYPTDSELIVDYLNVKIQSKENPRCCRPMHEVNIYCHKPEELAEQYYPSCENTWYFLTPRDRKYPRGNTPDRAVRNGGFWKATQKYKVYDDATRQKVGYKRSLVFYEKKDISTKWLMHEYTTNEPNLPIENRVNGNKQLNEWVLCKIYKKKQTANNNGNPIPNPKRRRVLENNETKTNTKPILNAMQPMTTFQDSSVIQPAQCYPNQITLNLSNSFPFSDGASSSGSISTGPPIGAVQPLDYGCYTLASDPANYHILQLNVQKSYQHPTSQLNVESGSNNIPQPDGGNAYKWIFDYLDAVTLDYLDSIMVDL